MFCTKCGAQLKEGTRFCPSCGGEVGNNKAATNNVVAPAPTVVVNNPAPKKKSHLGLILGIVFGALFLFIVGIFVIAILITGAIRDSADYHLVCTADDMDITIDYNDSGIIGYSASGMTYDFDEQSELAKEHGVDSYMEQFNDWFEKNSNGSCVIKDADGNITKDLATGKNNNNSNNNNNNNKNSGSSTTKTKVVGEEHYGYVEVPTNWVNFRDVDGGHQIQFSYGTTYIATLDYLDPSSNNSNMTAKELASFYLSQQKEDENVTGVTGATVTIGKDKKYTAYQVYMYYPADDDYLVTYWFDAEDGYIHYIAIEGPEGVEDYTSIPESFSLTK